jgi:hypothetical protein
MESGKNTGTVVLNLMDGRERFFALPPEEAVVAAFKTSDNGGHAPDFSEYRLGYSCGDWIAYKDRCILK